MNKRFFSIIHNGNNYEVATVLRERGEELLLLLHGLGCSKETFRDIWFREELTDYSIMSLDFIGFGESTKSNQFSYRMEDQATLCAEVVREILPKQMHIIAHSMGGAIGLLLPPDLLNSTLTYANLEGNLISEDCGIISRKTISVPFQEFRDELLPDLKALSMTLGEGRLFLDSALPLGIYKSSDSLVKWSESGDLLSRFQQLPCKKAYFFGEKNSRLDVLKRLNTIGKVMIGKSGHFMMNDNPDEFYSRLTTFLNVS
ncbi:MAG: alpha/beta hydrolase [Deltaproteobacteria bacterium]|nr:alpha/beta hydrolase [Deltaproteobacteria bacterium]